MSIRTDTDELISKARTFIEALPYIKRYWEKTIVIKTGGRAMEDQTGLRSFVQDVLMLRLVGMRPVVVHGGGAQISDLMRRLNHEPTFIDGYRVTSSDELDVVRMALQKTNKEMVSLLNAQGDYGVGVSGEDANMIRAEKMTGTDGADLGFVGSISRVDPRVLEGLLTSGFIPVVAPMGVDEQGQVYNINADHAAGSVAAALKASKLVYLTDVEGLYEDFGVEDSLLSRVKLAELEALLSSGKLHSGMIPKVRSCIDALKSGVERAHMLDGRVEHALLLEIFTHEGVGTMVEP